MLIPFKYANTVFQLIYTRVYENLSCMIRLDCLFLFLNLDSGTSF